MARALEAAVADYLRQSDLPEVDLLRIWAQLRSQFVLLCGDPPPWRWLPSLSLWMGSVRENDPRFQPITFHCDWTLETLATPDEFLTLECTATSPLTLQTQYSDLVKALMNQAFDAVGPEWLQS